MQKSIIAAARNCSTEPQTKCSICDVRSMFFGELLFYDKAGEISHLIVCDNCVSDLNNKTAELLDLKLTSEYQSGTDAHKYYP